MRAQIAIGDRLRVWKVIDCNIRLAQAYLERLPDGAGLGGFVRECRAHTRKGTPCQRDPLPGRDYCPSHKHLEETYDGPEPALQELGASLEREGIAAAA